MLVTFEPGPGLEDRVRLAAAQLDRLYVVDNGSGADSAAVLERAEQVPGVKLIRNEDNRGQATALNEGLRRGLAAGYAWALLLDQDSECEPTLLDTLAGTFTAGASGGPAGPGGPRPIAVIGANYRETPDGPAHVTRDGPSPWLEQATVITSGSLISLAACTAIGLMRDDLFIDYVDHEFCLRARARGYRVVMSARPILRHAIGNVTHRPVAGRTVSTTNHSPTRRYYRARNRILVYGKYGLREPRWLLHDLWMALKSFAQMCLVEDERGTKLRSVALGVWHGVRGRFGPFPDDADKR